MTNNPIVIGLAIRFSSWQKLEIGKLEIHKKTFANCKKHQSYQDFMSDWQVGNCQLQFTTFQLLITYCFYSLLRTSLVGEKTPILRIGIALTLMPIRCVKVFVCQISICLPSPYSNHFLQECFYESSNLTRP